ncbi:ABC transporter permease [Natronorubrum sp. FCH18a]|uniref:ABC transporter permease n=1 Tax=Natronorubrum sp. FCH18a TaxID=3447018 RepID=UPI003F517037
MSVTSSIRRASLVRQGSLLFVLVCIYAFLLVPVVIVILTSFTGQSFPAVPYDGISLEWYAELMTDSQLLGALVTSFIVATVASLLSVAFGTAAAVGFVRAEFPYKQQLSTIMLLPMIISPVITGIALIRYFGMLDVSSGYPALIIGHSILTIPYVFLLVRSQLVTFDEDLEKASRVLGADSTVTFLNVTAPIISPALLAGFFVAFVVSFGEFTATQFLISPGSSTVPVEIYTMLRTGLTPTINALSTVLVVIMVAAALLSRYFE